MGKSAAATVAQYLAELPPDRRTSISKVRDVIVRNLPEGYEEGMAWGMITYTVPLARYPDTYNGQPLCYVGLAAQKSHCAVYLSGAYADPAVAKSIQDGFKKAGKKLDTGGSCVRFRSADDLPLEVIGRAVASVPPDAFIARHEKTRARARSARGRNAGGTAANGKKKAAKKK